MTVGVDPTLPENYALDFDGTNDHVSIADANSLDLTNTFSIEAGDVPPNVEKCEIGIV